MAQPWKYGISLDYSDWACQDVKQTTLPAGQCRADLLEQQLADERAKQKEQEVQRVLESIDKTKMGKALFVAIQKTGKNITVAGKTLLNTAEATAANQAAATPKGKYALQCSGSERGQKASPGVKGTGAGSDAIAWFTPGISSCSGADCKVSTKADEMLFHELFHVFRMAAGKYLCNPMTADQQKLYPHEEELFAVLVTNIYMSEKGEKALRSDYYDFRPMPEAVAKAFADSYKKFLQILRTQHRVFYDEAAKVVPKGGFNPLSKVQ